MDSQFPITDVLVGEVWTFDFNGDTVKAKVVETGHVLTISNRPPSHCWLEDDKNRYQVNLQTGKILRL